MLESKLKFQPPNTIKDKLAAWLSILLDSSVLAVPVFLAAARAEVGTILPALGWATLALLFADGIPLIYIAVGRRFGWISGFDLPRREERTPFIAVNLVGNLLGFTIMRYLNAPVSISALLLVYIALGVTMMTISFFWKISLHAGGVGGFAAFLTFMFGPVWALTFLALPLIGWARVYRKRHNWVQVVAGGILGTSITMIILRIVLRNV